MRQGAERRLLGMTLPVLLAATSWAAEPDQQRGKEQADSEAKRQAESQKAAAAPAATEKSPPSTVEQRPAAKEEALPLDKRLERLRSARADLESVAVEDPGSRIAPVQPVSRTEAGVPPRTPKLERPETLPQLSAREKERWFRTPEWRARFGELRRCPREVAFQRSVRPRAVTARRVVLRWTIDLEGRVRDAAVVAAGPVDPDVMSCIHRKMSEWQLSPRPNTPYRADWTLNLR
jgi:hypothetical protein